MAQQLVKNPQLFDHKVLVSTNLFMDIISEECAGLIGSIGLVYSANIGEDDAADRIIRATGQTIAAGTTTYDLGGSASMSQMTDAIIGNLE